MPSKERTQPHAPGQVARFQRFLTYLIPLFFIIGPLDILAAYWFDDVGSLAIGMIVTALGFVFLYARHLVSTGRLDAAVRVTYLAILAPILALVFFRPFLYPTLAAGAVLATAIALPFVNRRDLAWIASSSFAVAVGVVVAGTILHLNLGTTIPPTVQALDVAVTIVLVVGLTLLMLWALAGRLRESLTAARAAHAELQDANQELQAADDAKARFMNTSAHEINTPLTPMRIQTSLLLSQGDALAPEDRDRALTIIHRNTERLIRLAQDLLDAGRIQAGRLRLDPSHIDAGAIAQDAIDSMHEVAAEKEVTLETEIDRDLWVEADPVRLAQVVDIFLTNAMKFTPPGGRVVVTVARDDDQMALRVVDTGVGIPADRLDDVFDPFQQLDNQPQERPREGTGLGLHIARGLIEAQGGRVWVESDGEGQGSTFYATLPLSDSGGASAGIPTATTPQLVPEPSRESARLASGAGAASGSSRGNRPAGLR